MCVSDIILAIPNQQLPQAMAIYFQQLSCEILHFLSREKLGVAQLDFYCLITEESKISFTFFFLFKGLFSPVNGFSLMV